MAKPLNEMQKQYIDNNRDKNVDVLVVETGAAKTVIKKYLNTEPQSTPTVRENVAETKTDTVPTLVQMTKVRGGNGEVKKGVFSLTQAAAERGDAARKKYGSGIGKRYTDAIVKIDPDAGTY